MTFSKLSRIALLTSFFDSALDVDASLADHPASSTSTTSHLVFCRTMRQSEESGTQQVGTEGTRYGRNAKVEASPGRATGTGAEINDKLQFSLY
jgi:hypothetical protein